MINILVIDDDANINQLMVDVFSKAGYCCSQAFSGSEALLILEKQSFDLIILDLMIPGVSGDEFLKRIRPNCDTPVIVVSAKDELDSKVDMLSLGADDYITKPFEIRELLVRVTVQLRKANKTAAANELVFKDLKLDRESFSLFVSGNEILLTKQEFKILELLMTYPSKVFSKQEIYEYAWDNF